MSNFHARIDSSWSSCSNHHVTVCHYHTAGNFQRRKLSQIARLCRAKDVPPQISLRKLSWIATKPQNSWKLSPSKVFGYTVFSLILSTCLITCCSFLILTLAKSYTQYQKLWSLIGTLCSGVCASICTFTQWSWFPPPLSRVCSKHSTS